MSWVFVKSDSNIGDWRPRGGSPNTLEEYTITPGGTWVPEVDVEWLKGFKFTLACCKKRVKMFTPVRPCVEAMRRKPQREPVLKVGSNFGVEKVEESHG